MSDDERGTFECPRCGQESPHWHLPETPSATELLDFYERSGLIAPRSITILRSALATGHASPEREAVIVAAVSLMDDLNAYNSIAHPQVHARLLALQQSVSVYHATNTPPEGVSGPEQGAAGGVSHCAECGEPHTPLTPCPYDPDRRNGLCTVELPSGAMCELSYGHYGPHSSGEESNMNGVERNDFTVSAGSLTCACGRQYHVSLFGLAGAEPDAFAALIEAVKMYTRTIEDEMALIAAAKAYRAALRSAPPGRQT